MHQLIEDFWQKTPIFCGQLDFLVGPSTHCSGFIFPILISYYNPQVQELFPPCFISSNLHKRIKWELQQKQIITIVS